jgi:hypothetical protein
MGQQHLPPVAQLDPERRVSERADDSHSACDPDSVPVVVSVTGDQTAGQLPQRRHDQRRDEVPGEQHQVAAHLVKRDDGAADVIYVVVGVCEDSDLH